MANIFVTTRSGETLKIGAELGESVMALIRAAGIDDLAALCSGSCSCATCHVYVDADQRLPLPPADNLETELLFGSQHCTAASRLSCQLIFNDELDGLRVTIAPED